MNIHLGFHWSMIMAMVKKATHTTVTSLLENILLRAAALVMSIYGAYAFITERIASNMFLQTEFVFFDYEATAIEVLGKYVAMMILFMAIAYYGSKLLEKPRVQVKEKIR
ncbi:MAG TPA: hypothetical protein VJY37_03240 [Anaerovoracaceae bacterium]|nr:hypothetical protein [Anaerovoracaceae bacterium]